MKSGFEFIDEPVYTPKKDKKDKKESCSCSCTK